jgi:hypothetical protein
VKSLFYNSGVVEGGGFYKGTAYTA